LIGKIVKLIFYNIFFILFFFEIKLTNAYLASI